MCDRPRQIRLRADFDPQLRWCKLILFPITQAAGKSAEQMTLHRFPLEARIGDTPILASSGKHRYSFRIGSEVMRVV